MCQARIASSLGQSAMTARKPRLLLTTILNFFSLFPSQLKCPCSLHLVLISHPVVGQGCILCPDCQRRNRAVESSDVSSQIDSLAQPCLFQIPESRGFGLFHYRRCHACANNRTARRHQSRNRIPDDVRAYLLFLAEGRVISGYPSSRMCPACCCISLQAQAASRL